MHFIESGVGPPLVLLHAFPVDARMWNRARALLEEHARVITPDQRGLGESSLNGSSARNLAEPTRRPVDAPSMAAAAADVIALLDTLDLPRVLLGGCSMGGYVAMAVLRAAPERVAGLLLADTKAIADDRSSGGTGCRRPNARSVRAPTAGSPRACCPTCWARRPAPTVPSWSPRSGT
ncbi:hypothetical protein GCM10010470_10000 [Saccharopolyspora taberi]|uniref:AB hydrolase-1 domain-containing protein n=1 Tax=Saccharopolyspora taberi TaxID=60895 RepID=A0ABN3V4Z1_9PSEU